MVQLVPSAGFTPPCDYSNFADSFDLSLLPSEPPSTPIYKELKNEEKIKIFSGFATDGEIESEREFQNFLVPDQSLCNPIYLEVPTSKNYHANSPIGALSPYSSDLSHSPGSFSSFDNQSFYPNSPEVSFYSTPSPQNFTYKSEDLIFIKKEIGVGIEEQFCSQNYTKEENFNESENFSKLPKEDLGASYPKGDNFSESENFPKENFSKEDDFVKGEDISKTEFYKVDNFPKGEFCKSDEFSGSVFEILSSTILEKDIKQESTVDFGSILGYRDSENLRQILESPPLKRQKRNEDHQLLRECLRDTSYQRKYNLKPVDLDVLEGRGSVKMEEENEDNSVLLDKCSEQLAGPVLKIYMEQMRKDIASTCNKLNITSGKKNKEFLSHPFELHSHAFRMHLWVWYFIPLFKEQAMQGQRTHGCYLLYFK